MTDTTVKYAPEKDVYYVTHIDLELNDEGQLDNCHAFVGYDAAVAYATKQAASDRDFDPRYVFKLVAKVQNTPPELPVTTF